MKTKLRLNGELISKLSRECALEQIRSGKAFLVNTFDEHPHLLTAYLFKHGEPIAVFDLRDGVKVEYRCVSQ